MVGFLVDPLNKVDICVRPQENQPQVAKFKTEILVFKSIFMSVTFFFLT